MIMDDSQHPLFGKETTCHQCHGMAVWVFNGNSVGNYHYCRACKIETGPFAKGLSLPEVAYPSPMEIDFWTQGLKNFQGNIVSTAKKRTASGIALQMEMETQKRWEQMVLDATIWGTGAMILNTDYNYPTDALNPDKIWD